MNFRALLISTGILVMSIGLKAQFAPIPPSADEPATPIAPSSESNLPGELGLSWSNGENGISFKTAEDFEDFTQVSFSTWGYNEDSTLYGWQYINTSDYTRDGAGKILEIIRRDTMTGQSIARFSYEYDSVHRDRFSSLLIENWNDSLSDWQNATQYLYQYDPNGNQILFKNSRWNADSSTWDVFSKTITTYNGSNLQTSRLSLRNFGTGLDSTNWVTREYDSKESLTEFISYRWNGTMRYIQSGYQRDFTYDVDDNQLTLTHRNYVDSTSTFDNSYQNTRAYDSDGLQSSFTRQNWEDGMWVNSFRDINYAYDSEGLLMEYYGETWDDSIWAPTWHITGYLWDSLGRETFREARYWSSTDSVYNNAWRYSNIFSPDSQFNLTESWFSDSMWYAYSSSTNWFDEAGFSSGFQNQFINFNTLELDIQFGFRNLRTFDATMLLLEDIYTQWNADSGKYLNVNLNQYGSFATFTDIQDIQVEEKLRVVSEDNGARIKVFHANFAAQQAEIQLLDMSGRIVQSTHLQQPDFVNGYSIPAYRLPKGLYIVRIVSPGKLATAKFLKR